MQTMLIAQRIYDVYWIDKWHASPYYGTVISPSSGRLQAQKWLKRVFRQPTGFYIHTQHEDGSWGFFQKAQQKRPLDALTALLHYKRYKPVDPDILHQGRLTWPMPIKKRILLILNFGSENAYTRPMNVVRSLAILAALILYNETFGHSTYSAP